jgi:hypothetical protein
MAQSNTENKNSWRQKITGAVIVAYAVIVGIILYYQGTEMFFRVRYAIASAVIFIVAVAGAGLIAWMWTSPGSAAQRAEDDQDHGDRTAAPLCFRA